MNRYQKTLVSVRKAPSNNQTSNNSRKSTKACEYNNQRDTNLSILTGIRTIKALIMFAQVH